MDIHANALFENLKRLILHQSRSKMISANKYLLQFILAKFERPLRFKLKKGGDF